MKPFHGSHLEFSISRLDTIKAHFHHEHTGFEARGQISSTATRDEVMTYIELGKMHAYELQDAWKLMSPKLPKSCHILDIACGVGLTPAALHDIGVDVESYQGYDHNEWMVDISTRINLDTNIVIDFEEVNDVPYEAVVLFNHVFGQNTVSERDLHMWSTELMRVMPEEFDVLNIEIPNLPKPAQVPRDRFKKICQNQGFSLKIVQENNTPGRHKFSKITQHWRLSKLN